MKGWDWFYWGRVRISWGSVDPQSMCSPSRQSHVDKCQQGKAWEERGKKN